jgi:cytosine/adenosine deaminase-related metal-dependent hydrolase
MISSHRDFRGSREGRLALAGARCALGTEKPVLASIEIESGKIARILRSSCVPMSRSAAREAIDLRGYFLLPGLINAHDHLEFALYPRMADGPYRNYVEWGEDIHRKFPEVIARHHAVPMNIRLLWGGIRNLLCGVTTVCHHNPLWPQLLQDHYPIRVVKNYGWAHSVALGEDLTAAQAAKPRGSVFIIHAGEGVDDLSRDELAHLEELGVLNASTVVVHGLAFNRDCVALMKRRGAALVVCPTSNELLYDRTPDMRLIGKIRRLALGSDSPLTSTGDLLDEIRFAIDRCGIAPSDAYEMVTHSAAEILQLGKGEGSIVESGAGDVIAIADCGVCVRERMKTIAWEDIELVVIGGSVQLASASMLERMPRLLAEGLEAVSVDGTFRWVRAPIREMLYRAETVLGVGNVRVGGKPICAAGYAEAEYVA